MGVEAVAKQAAANIFVSGAGALGVEIAKNLVLSGCKSFTLHDTQPVTNRDLSGQFFCNLSEGKTRSEVCLPKLQQLNFYVRCGPTIPIPLDASEYEKEPWNFQNIDVFILTEADYKTVIAVDNYCRSKGKKFIYTDLKGVFGRVFNDFGDNFEVLDKNGEELQDCMVKSITNEEEGVVTLHDNTKHNLEDGDEIMLVNVEGMKLKAGET
jgi:molybdopterin/thiamine biosynthesis adenylyltransferase